MVEGGGTPGTMSNGVQGLAVGFAQVAYDALIKLSCTTSGPVLIVRGDIGNHFAVSRCRARDWMLVPLTLARLPLFHRRLDGVTVTHRLRDPVKVR